MVFEMKLYYIIISYVLIVLLVFFGVRHIMHLQSQVDMQKREINNMREERTLLIKAYNEEIAEINNLSKQRRVLLRDISKNANEENNCLNLVIPDYIRNRVHKHIEQ